MPVNARIVERAREVAERFALRGEDAVHFASLLSAARGLGNDVEQVVLLTSDRELKAAAVSVGIPVIDPELATATG